MEKYSAYNSQREKGLISKGLDDYLEEKKEAQTELMKKRQADISDIKENRVHPVYSNKLPNGILDQFPKLGDMDNDDIPVFYPLIHNLYMTLSSYEAYLDTGEIAKFDIMNKDTNRFSKHDQLLTLQGRTSELWNAINDGVNYIEATKKSNTQMDSAMSDSIIIELKKLLDEYLQRLLSADKRANPILWGPR